MIVSRFFKSISEKMRISPGSQLPDKPWSVLAKEVLRFNQVLCTCMSTQWFIVKDASVGPLTWFFGGLFVPGQIRI